jgi:uracil-DNA glycosylase
MAPPRTRKDPLYELPPSWKPLLEGELSKPYFRSLAEFVANERTQHEVFPPAKDVYAALAHTPFEKVNVLLLGQDPYPTPGHAHGLCFSVPPGVRVPASLANMYKELASDLGLEVPIDGCLIPWAEQGILLLNAVLTVRSGIPNSHKGKGWETFTDTILRKVNDKPEPVVFVLWGAYAQKKRDLIDASRHTILTAAHPSPLSARSGFFGSRPFSAINRALRAYGKPEIRWTA